MAENYLFEFYGARFNITAELGGATTTEPPNLRVIEGAWKTWRLTVDQDVPGIEGLRLQQSVAAGGGAHPHGNLSPAESASQADILMIAENGSLYRMPGGWGAVSRMYSEAEWEAQRAEWEQALG
ncbi:hypothetical protein ABE10_10990 [Bacillus toyonensis]|nr:hypothetical protein [Bacillus toyonensis]